MSAASQIITTIPHPQIILGMTSFLFAINVTSHSTQRDFKRQEPHICHLARQIARLVQFMTLNRTSEAVVHEKSLERYLYLMVIDAMSKILFLPVEIRTLRLMAM